MGFWEDQGESQGDGVGFLTSDEFNELKAAEATITITAVSAPVPDAKYGGERFIVTFSTNGDESVKYGFKTGQVDSRDRNLAAMRDYLAAGNESVAAKLKPIGTQGGVTFTAA